MTGTLLLKCKNIFNIRISSFVIVLLFIYIFLLLYLFFIVIKIVLVALVQHAGWHYTGQKQNYVSFVKLSFSSKASTKKHSFSFQLFCKSELKQFNFLKKEKISSVQVDTVLKMKILSSGKEKTHIIKIKKQLKKKANPKQFHHRK